MREYGLNLILPLKVLCSFELRQLETDPGFFRSHFFMILTSSVKAMQQHRIKLPLGALMLFWPPRRRNSIPSVYQCFQMGKGAMSRTQPWVGASHGGGAPFEQHALSPNWCSQSFFHCCSTAGLQPTVARELQREPSPSSLLYAAQSRTCWNHSNPILVWAQPERQIPVCMATRSASKRSQWGEPGPQGPALFPLHSSTGITRWMEHPQATPLSPPAQAPSSRCGKLNSIFTNVRGAHISTEMQELRFIPHCAGAVIWQRERDRLSGKGRCREEEVEIRLKCEEHTRAWNTVPNRDAGTRSSNKPCRL